MVPPLRTLRIHRSAHRDDGWWRCGARTCLDPATPGRHIVAMQESGHPAIMDGIFGAPYWRALRPRLGEKERERSSSSLRTGRNNAISGVETTSTDRPDASSYDSARASDQTRSRIPALQTQDRRIYIYNLICTGGEFRDGVSLRILHDAVIAS